MTTSQTDPNPQTGAVRTFCVRLMFSTVVVGILLFAGRHSEQLLLGWLYFLTRTIPRVTIDLPSVIVGAMALMAFFVVVHRIGERWRASQCESKSDVLHRWTWGTSLSVCTGMVTVFAAGTVLVGMCHQLIWICTGREDTSEVVTPADLGWIAQARDAAQRTQAKNSLKLIGLALHNHHDTFGAFPVGGTMLPDGELLHGWMMAIGPFHSYAATNLDSNTSWRSNANARIYKCQLESLLNPCQPGALFDKDGFGLAHWAGNVHVMPIVTVRSQSATIDSTISSQSADSGQSADPKVHLEPQGMRLEQITDGTSQTILVGSVGQNFRPWGHPANVRDPAMGINQTPEGFGGPPGWNGAMFLMCDGSVQFLPETTELSILKSLATPKSGDSLLNFRGPGSSQAGLE